MNPQEFSVFQMILTAGPMVRFVIIILFLFSVATWTIIFIKALQLRRAFAESNVFIDFFWQHRDFSRAFARAKELSSSPVAQMFLAAFMELRRISRTGNPGDSNHKLNPAVSPQDAIANIKRALNRAANSESVKLIRMVPFLATAGNIAPFIGLFGTVWGIMTSFHGMAYNKGATSLSAVAPGISEALIATAFGLFVAIPAVIGYNYFVQKIRIIEAEMSGFADDFLNIVEIELRRG